MITPVLEVLKELQVALSEVEKVEHTLEQARAKLAPLEESAKAANDRVSVLMNQWQGLKGDAPKGRRNAPGKRAYNVSPESKVAATIKRQTTRALNAGKSEAEAKKIGQAAGKALAQKLGVK